MKRLLVLLSMTAVIALVGCQNRGAKEGGQGQQQQQPGAGTTTEPGRDVRTAHPSEQGGASGSQRNDSGSRMNQNPSGAGGAGPGQKSPGSSYPSHPGSSSGSGAPGSGSSDSGNR